MPKSSKEQKALSEAEIERALQSARLFDLDRARQSFARIAARVRPSVSDTILPLLHDLPDPDGALNLFDRLVENADPELVRIFEKHRALIHYALTVFGYSQYLGETLLQNTDLLHGLLREENLGRSHSPEEFKEAFARFRSRSFDTDVAQLLARFKRREYVRIMLRDVLGLATLAETTAEISSLSDVLIDEATRQCEALMKRKCGPPQHVDRNGKIVETPFTVLALGKLGGNELNYSSDVDLLFLYAEGEAPESSLLSNREYFIRLSQAITDVLSRVTKEGVVFRIDLRLRPQGHEGEPAVSLNRALEYYSEVAHDWERQALIKVRHCAGDVALARQFIRKVQDDVYKPDINFSAIGTALEARDRIHTRRRGSLAPEKGIDVKLDRGGIRDIEFLVQCLQRVYGGKERWLRSGGTLFSLQKLHDKQHIDGSDFHQLTTSYEALRRIEHLLQLRRGQQTHRVPASGHELKVLQRALDCSDVLSELRDRLTAVAEIYERIVHHQQQQTEQQVQEEFALRTLDLSFGRVHSDHQVLQRLAADNQQLHEIAGRPMETHTRRNLFRFLSSALTSGERYAAVAADPDAVDSALDLFRHSEYLTDLLVRHPDDIGILRTSVKLASADQSTLFPMESESQTVGTIEYLDVPDASYAQKLAMLRRQYRRDMLTSGARDLLHKRPVFDSLSESTRAAEKAIRGAYSMAGSPDQIAIVALGRLGTVEFDFLSDADLLFVRAVEADPEHCTKAAEAIIQALSVYTSEGALMPVDLRLRPHGGEGELTFTANQLSAYFLEEAHPWEALSFTKLRGITGNREVAEQAISSTRVLNNRFAEDPTFENETRVMRRRLATSEEAEDFKTAEGGFYDIDFLVSFLAIKHRVEHMAGNTLQRIYVLQDLGVLGEEDGRVLANACIFYRTLDHSVRLVTGRNLKTLPPSDFARETVASLVSRDLNPGPSKLPEAVSETKMSVREVFERFLTERRA